MKDKFLSFIIVLWLIILKPSSGFCLNPAAYPYITAVRARIMQLVNASTLVEDKQEGVVTLRICITPEGLLKYAQIKESSGSETLDNIAMTTLDRAFPFIPFPPKLNESELWIEVPVVFGEKTKAIIMPEEPIFPLPLVHELPELARKGRIKSMPPTQQKAILKTQGTLEEYIKIALANYQPVQVAQEQVNLSHLKIKEAERNFYPRLSGEYKESKGKTITDPFQSVSYGLQMEQLLLGITQFRDALERERIGLQMARRNYDKLKNDVRYEVTKAYYELISENQMLQLWQKASDDMKGDLELCQRLYGNGLIIESEFKNAQSQYNLVSYQVESAVSSVSLARLSLLQTMNLTLSQIDQIEIPKDFEVESKDLELNLEECINLALRTRPEIEIWQMATDSAKINEIIATRENRPKFSLVSSYGRSGEAYASESLDMLGEWSVMGRFTWLFGPNSMEYSHTQDRTLAKRITDTTYKTESSTENLKFSLADRLDYYSTAKEATISYKQALNELNDTQKKVLYEVKDSYLAYKRAFSGIQAALARVKFRQKELEVTKVRTQVGEGSFVDILEAKMNLANEISLHLRSLKDYFQAIAALERATAYNLTL